MKLVIDLCSGLGGFSQAFQNNLEWDVVTIDIERKLRPSIIADIRFLPLRDNLSPDLLLASPPCERFSIACPVWPKPGIMKAMEVVGACFEAVARLKPKQWLVENPMGRLRWFLGTPTHTIRLCDYGAPYQKKTDLWGTVVFPMLKETHHKGNMNPELTNWKVNRKTGKPYSPLAWMDGHNKANRSKMPFGLSQVIMESIEITSHE